LVAVPAVKPVAVSEVKPVAVSEVKPVATPLLPRPEIAA
jgi:hypothetical protein